MNLREMFDQAYQTTERDGALKPQVIVFYDERSDGERLTHGGTVVYLPGGMTVSDYLSRWRTRRIKQRINRGLSYFHLPWRLNV